RRGTRRDIHPPLPPLPGTRLGTGSHPAAGWASRPVAGRRIAVAAGGPGGARFFWGVWGLGAGAGWGGGGGAWGVGGGGGGGGGRGGGGGGAGGGAAATGRAGGSAT